MVQLYKKAMLLSLLCLISCQNSSAGLLSGFAGLSNRYKLVVIAATTGLATAGGVQLYNKGKRPEDKVSLSKAAFESTAAVTTAAVLWLYRNSIMSLFYSNNNNQKPDSNNESPDHNSNESPDHNSNVESD